MVLAPEVIEVLMGEGWDHAVMPFRVLSLTMLFRTTQKLGGLVATAAGAVNAVGLAYVVYMVLVIGGAAISVRWGIEGVAYSTGFAIVAVGLECSYLSIRVSDQTWGDWARAHGPGLVLSLLAAGVTWAVASQLRALGLSAPVIVVASLAPAIVGCLVLCLVWVRRGHGDFRWLADELGRLTRRFRRGRRSSART
jgi:O-antigen/teichoic acid export membrane protein